MLLNYRLKSGALLDATRISDGKLVGLKRVRKPIHPLEAEICQLFSSEPLASHPDNHCVPLYEVLDPPSDPDTIILVMPFLRKYDSPQLQTIGEVVEFFRQAFKGMQFIHKHCVAHRYAPLQSLILKAPRPSDRDGHRLNIMYDATTLYPDGHHPHPIYNYRKPDFTGRARHYTRTEYPPKYYWIDFGLSTRHDPESTSPPAETRIFGGDKSVPEFQPEAYKDSYNPFPTDVYYYVGNLIKTDFFDVSAAIHVLSTH